MKDDIIKSIWNNTKDSYNRDTSITYYDTTNYYFEISYNDEDLIDENGNVLEKGSRKKGPSKEHRKTPIIGMGLLMDKNAIPLSYDLFPGNESEKLMMRPTLKKTKSKFGINRTIIVADRGQNTSDNTVFIAGKNDDDHINHDGYVYGQSIIGADKEFKTWALDQSEFINDYVYGDDGNLITYKAAVKDENGNILRYEDKPVIFKHKSSNNIRFNEETGEVPEGLELSLKLDKIKEEEKYDGYYSIVTSEKNLSDKEIRDIYKGLWKIEESFKITKSDLETRPVFVWTKEHIEAHFLTCFISLVILRLIESKTNRKFSTKSIINSLKQYTSNNLEHDIYLQNFTNDIIKDLSKIYNVDLSRKYLTLSEIKKILNF